MRNIINDTCNKCIYKGMYGCNLIESCNHNSNYSESVNPHKELRLTEFEQNVAKLIWPTYKEEKWDYISISLLRTNINKLKEIFKHLKE